MHADTSAVSLAFQRWLEANGVLLGEIELSSIKGRRRGHADGSGESGGGESRSLRRRRRRTVLSTASSAPGSLIARVPDSAVLTVSSSSAAEALEAAGLGNKNGGGTTPPRRRQESSSSSSPWKEAAGLALALLVESRLGEASRFAPYVRWLLWEGEGEEEDEEKATAHPVTWDPRAAAVLFAGTAVASRLLRLPSSSSSSPGGPLALGGLHAPSAAPLSWSRLARPWLSRVGMLEDAAAEKKKKRGGKKPPSPSHSPSRPPPPPSSSSLALLRAEVFRCLAVVSSYAFVLGEDQILALVPVFDALDHAPGPPRVRLSHSCCPSGGGSGGAGDGDGDDGDDGDDDNDEDEEEGGGGFLEMRSTVPLSRGQEVFNSYGRLSTSALARRYGFTVADRGEMLLSGDERLEVGAAEVGVAAAAAVTATSAATAAAASSTSSSCRPLRAPAACLRAAAASKGKALFVSVPSGEPSLGLLLAVRASLSARNINLEGRALLEVARRRRAALEAGGARAARAALLAKKLRKRKREGGGRRRQEGGNDGGSEIVFPPASGFELAEAVRKAELEGCASLELWVKRRMLLL